MVKLYDIGRLRFYAGLMIVTAAVMMLQIIETRIISVISWYYLAFFVISVAMFGLTAGAVWVYLHPKVFTPSYLSFHLAVSTLGFALATVASLLVQLTLATTLSPTFTGVVVWTEFALALAVPFFFSGIAISLALMRSPYPVGKVYGVDLLGAATGCLGVLLALNLTSGPAAVLWLAAALAGAALLFAVPCAAVAPAGRTTARGLFRRRRLVCAVLLLLAGTNELTGHGVHPLFVKDKAESQEQFDYEGWNSFSRIMITKNMVNKSPRLWGPSPHIPVYRVEQREMNIDGGAGTVMYHFGGDLEELAFLRYDITNLAYAIPGLKTGAVIGVGGGRDLLSARLLGVERVVGVEINPILIDLLTNGFADYTAIDRVPGISFEVDEARSWFARADQTFDVIQMSLIDTWAATGAGAFTLSENGLYTIEAWRIFLDRLSPEGVFTVSRWYAPGEVNETGRMVSLAVATLLDLGVTEPQRHLFLASTDNIATLIVSRSPLSHDTLDALHGSATQHGFSVLISPNHRPSSPVLQGIVAVADRAGLNVATQDYYLDLTPPTDARPFFLQPAAVRPTVRRGDAKTLPASRCNGRQPRRDHDAGYARDGFDGPSAGDYRGASAIERSARGVPARDRRNRLLLADRGRLHDNRDRAPAADERIPGPSRLRAQHRSIQPHPGDWDRQLRLRAPAARHRPQAYRLGDVDLRLSRGVAGVDTAGAA